MSFSRHFLTCAAGAFFIGVVATPASATVARNGTVAQRASTTLGESGAVVVAHDDAWDGAIRDLTASARSDQTIGQNMVDAHSSILAHWDTADSGYVSLTDHGWTTTGSDPEQLSQNIELNIFEGGAPDWTYSFTAEGFDTFTLASHISGSGGNDNVGLGFWSLTFAEEGGPADVVTLHQFLATNPDQTNFFSHQLIAGRTYHVSLRSDEGRFIAGVGADRVADETARFDWRITGSGGVGDGVPEPSTWALAIVGFGMVGSAVRRRRSGLAR